MEKSDRWFNAYHLRRWLKINSFLSLLVAVSLLHWHQDREKVLLTTELHGLRDDVAASLDYKYLLTCNGKCGPMEKCFLGKCFCLPGRTGSGCQNIRTADWLLTGDHCPVFHTLKEVQEKPVQEYPVEACHIAEKDPLSCGIFCYWQEDAGIIQVPKSSWERVSDIEYAIWKNLEKMGPDDRNPEHAEGLGAFAALPSDLGNYLEIGAGPYTQTNNILNVRNNVRIKNIYLAEPNIFRYLALDNCIYKDNTIHGQRVNLLSLPVEELPATEFFDTVVAINVIEHVFSAIDFLTAVYSALKPGGILVFGERYFDDPDKDALVLGSALLHPIRVKRVFLQHFLRMFDTLYIGDHHTSFAKARGFEESGYYFIGRKKEIFSAFDEPGQAELDTRFPANPF